MCHDVTHFISEATNYVATYYEYSSPEATGLDNIVHTVASVFVNHSTKSIRKYLMGHGRGMYHMTSCDHNYL